VVEYRPGRRYVRIVPGAVICKRTDDAPARENTTVYDPIGGSHGMSVSHGPTAATARVSLTFGAVAAFDATVTVKVATMAAKTSNQRMT
jgi:hypothetical protein